MLLKKRTEDYTHVKVTPLARNVMDEHNLDVDAIIRGLKKLTRQDVERVVNQFSSAAGQPLTFSAPPVTRTEETTPMSPLRRKLSKRLVAVKNETAMLTTFNEVDMSAVLDLRKKHQQAFMEKHGIKLGLMSFFMKAAAEALRAFPQGKFNDRRRQHDYSAVMWTLQLQCRLKRASWYR